MAGTSPRGATHIGHLPGDTVCPFPEHQAPALTRDTFLLFGKARGRWFVLPWGTRDREKDHGQQDLETHGLYSTRDGRLGGLGKSWPWEVEMRLRVAHPSGLDSQEGACESCRLQGCGWRAGHSWGRTSGEGQGPHSPVTQV